MTYKIFNKINFPSCQSFINPVPSNPYIFSSALYPLPTACLYPFLSFKPNFKNTKMNINHYTTNIYKQKPLGGGLKKEPKRTQLKSHSATIHLFMQNKANLRNAKMNITSYKTNNYKENRLTGESKNKPKTNPNKPNFPPKTCAFG